MSFTKSLSSMCVHACVHSHSMGDTSLMSGINFYIRWRLQVHWKKIKSPTDISVSCCCLYLQLTLDADSSWCLFLVINYKQKSI